MAASEVPNTIVQVFFQDFFGAAGMSQEVSKWLVSGLQPTLQPFANFLGHPSGSFGCFFLVWGNGKDSAISGGCLRWKIEVMFFFFGGGGGWVWLFFFVGLM